MPLLILREKFSIQLDQEFKKKCTEHFFLFCLCAYVTICKKKTPVLGTHT